jgi:DNA topoisomerase VI subunit B
VALAAIGKAKKLERNAFTVSREFEFFSDSELTRQTGYAKELWWPAVVVKELVDNALDACEEGGASPIIDIRLGTHFLEVCDSGPGLQPNVVKRVLDFSTRTSTKQAYVSPTRGAQGNALKTILAIPYVLSGSREAAVEITACGVKHLISVSADTIAQRPQITHESSTVVKKEGTRIRLTRNSAFA